MLRKIKQSMKAWWRRNVVADDPNPEYSRLDRMDGLPRRAAVDTETLQAALSDGDARALGITDGIAANVIVTADGALIHGDLGGAR